MSAVCGGRSGWRGLARAALVASAVSVAGTSVMADSVKNSRIMHPQARVANRSTALAISPPPRAELDGLLSATTFAVEGLNLDTNRAAGDNQGFYWRVPEPCGAVGPNHLLSTNSGAISWYTKAGVAQNTQLLGRNRLGSLVSPAPFNRPCFFNALAPLTETSQPRVVYDSYSNRFVVVAADWTATAFGDASNSSSILVAVSDDSDPNGTWYTYKVPTAISVGGSLSFAPAPEIAVGPTGIFITSNFYSFTPSGNSLPFTGSRLIIVKKTPLYTGGAGVSTVYDPSALVGFSAGFQMSGLVPVQPSGPVPDGLLVFLVSTGWYSTSTTDPGADLMGIIEVDGTVDAPTFPPTTPPDSLPLYGGSGFLGLGNVSDETFSYLAPQKNNANTIDASGPAKAILRDGHLWVVFAHGPLGTPEDGQATVHWIDLDVLGDTVAQGDIGGEDIAVGTSTYYPSIAINSTGSVAISFEASGANVFPGAYYTGRLAADPLGEWSVPKPLAAGVDYFFRIFGSSDPTINGLGPTSSTAVDPATDTFWSFNGYALARGTVFVSLPNEDGRWGTRWGAFKITGATGDFNLDSFVDNTDLEAFRNCFTGPKVPYAGALPAGCTGPAAAADAQGHIAADFDLDGDVDLADWGIIQKCFSGALPAALDCAQ